MKKTKPEKKTPSLFFTRIKKYGFWALLGLALIIVGFGLWYILQFPKTQAQWSSEHQFSPTVRQNGTMINVFRYRDFKYNQGSIQERRWEERKFDLKNLQGLEIIITEGERLNHNAQAMLIFDFGVDGDIAVSIEPRLERKEVFSNTNALCRKHELIYVFGSEEDLLTLRKLQGVPLYRIPLDTTFEQNRILLTSIIERAKGLRQSPEWYHPWFNSSHGNLMTHLKKTFGKLRFYQLRQYNPDYLLQQLFDWEAVKVNTNSLKQLKQKTKILP